jgi:hydroxymethylpyrimidine/phosphomethylpyrimidine kinase
VSAEGAGGARRGGRAGAQGRAARRGERTRTALTIAGSDSGGGAGIQADLKAFARCGVHGLSALTAVTAQSTVGVNAIHAIPPEMILAQVRAVAADFGVDAVKVGMLGDSDTIAAVARALDELPAGTPVVVDPVLVAESGARLLAPEAQGALVREIVPRATVLTPNLPEARALTGARSPDRAPAGAPGGHDEQEATDVEALARALLSLGAGAVVLTGGHRARAVDVYLERIDGEPVEIPGERHADGAAHGSGCTHSAVLAAQLALGAQPLQAARRARELAGEAVRLGLRELGAGAGPVDVLDLRARRGEV